MRLCGATLRRHSAASAAAGPVADAGPGARRAALRRHSRQRRREHQRGTLQKWRGRPGGAGGSAGGLGPLYPGSRSWRRRRRGGGRDPAGGAGARWSRSSAPEVTRFPRLARSSASVHVARTGQSRPLISSDLARPRTEISLEPIVGQGVSSNDCGLFHRSDETADSILAAALSIDCRWSAVISGHPEDWAESLGGPRRPQKTMTIRRVPRPLSARCATHRPATLTPLCLTHTTTETPLVRERRRMWSPPPRVSPHPVYSPSPSPGRCCRARPSPEPSLFCR